uniref:hypothetical protein n=1 Tax=Klebsiella pneumoniae TaxID=573 RepID=UPI003075C6F3
LPLHQIYATAVSYTNTLFHAASSSAYISFQCTFLLMTTAPHFSLKKIPAVILIILKFQNLFLWNN